MWLCYRNLMWTISGHVMWNWGATYMIRLSINPRIKFFRMHLHSLITLDIHLWLIFMPFWSLTLLLLAYFLTVDLYSLLYFLANYVFESDDSFLGFKPPTLFLYLLSSLKLHIATYAYTMASNMPLILQMVYIITLVRT